MGNSPLQYQCRSVSFSNTSLPLTSPSPELLFLAHVHASAHMDPLEAFSDPPSTELNYLPFSANIAASMPENLLGVVKGRLYNANIPFAITGLKQIFLLQVDPFALIYSLY